jgi:hypothetical protein
MTGNRRDLVVSKLQHPPVMVSEARTISRSGSGEGESNHPENASTANAASGNSPQAFSRYVNATARNRLQRKIFLRELPAAAWAGIHSRDASTCAYPASPDSRGAQHDKFETFFRKLAFLSCGTDALPIAVTGKAYPPIRN